MNIGERIKKLRERQGLTLEQVGQYVGVNKATVQRYETGNIDIKRTTAIKLAEILNTTPAFVMGWTDADSSAEYSREQLNKKELNLLSNYRSMNSDGQSALLALSETMCVTPMYQKCDKSSSLA